MSNTTSLMGPLSKDIVMAVPRMMARAGSFAFITVPERIDSMLGFRHGGSMIAEATGNGTWSMLTSAISASSATENVVPTAARVASATESPVKMLGPLSFMQVRNFGGIFTYMTSKWALACFTLVSYNATHGALSFKSHDWFSLPFQPTSIDVECSKSIELSSSTDLL